MKKIILLSLLLVSGYSLAADRCPSIAEIKQGNFRGWHLTMNGRQETDEEVKEFIKESVSFSYVMWRENKKSWGSAAVCEYYPTSRKGHLGKFNLPKPTGKDWHTYYEFAPDTPVYACSFDVEKCTFY